MWYTLLLRVGIGHHYVYGEDHIIIQEKSMEIQGFFGSTLDTRQHCIQLYTEILSPLKLFERLESAQVILYCHVTYTLYTVHVLNCFVLKAFFAILTSHVHAHQTANMGVNNDTAILTTHAKKLSLCLKIFKPSLFGSNGGVWRTVVSCFNWGAYTQSSWS